MSDPYWRNLVEMVFETAAQKSAKPMLWAKKDGAYVATTWAEVADQVAQLAAALRAKGLEDGDRVVLLSDSRPEWCIADIAIMAAGGITVPAYTTNTTRDHGHIVENSGAKGAIVSSAALAKNFLPAAHESDRMSFAIMMEEPSLSQRLNVDLTNWDDALAAEAPNLAANIEEVRQRYKAIQRDDTACIIYTSGTGGAPKGVMLHHGAILHNCEGAKEVVDELGIRVARFLSFLPLSHAYEHSGGQFLPIYLGGSIYYAESLDKLVTNLAEARPTIMTVVPRLFEMLRMRITRAMKQEGKLKVRLFERAIELGSRRFTDNPQLSVFEHIENLMLDLLVRRKVRKRFGGHIQALISGGAPLNPDVGMFFNALGLRLLQGYGQTESAPVVSVNRAADISLETVGRPLKNTELRIAEDGEILVRGELVMRGYWRDDEATAAAIDDDGWLHTGDIGIVDDHGHLMITDRKKDLIVNNKGDNVSPQRIEGMLTLEPEIAQAMIYGDGKPHLVGLIVPDHEWQVLWARENGKSRHLSELKDDKDFIEAVGGAVKRVNEHVSNLETLRRFIIADEAFTIENAQMTPKMSIRRHVISAIYGERLEGLY